MGHVTGACESWFKRFDLVRGGKELGGQRMDGDLIAKSRISRTPADHFADA
jgi:hypothetical protein